MARSDREVVSTPPTVILPAVGRSTPARQWSSVVFPLPDGPMMATCVPWGSERLMPARAWTGLWPRM